MAFSPLTTHRAPTRPDTAVATSQSSKAPRAQGSPRRASAAHSSAARGALWESPCLSLFSFAGIEEWRGVKRGGDVTKILDKSIGKRAYVIKGPIASSNFIEIPNPEAALPADRAPINATGPFIYVEYKPIPGLPPGAMVLFHLDLTTSAGSFRVSCCSTFSEYKIAGAGTLRVPLRPSPDGRWTVLALDIPALLAQHCPKTSSGGGSSVSVTYRALRAVKLCSNMVVRGVYTSHSALSPSTLPADMKLPLSKEGSWHESYAWVWCPQPPVISTHSPEDNDDNAAAFDTNIPPTTPNQRRARAAQLSSSLTAMESGQYTSASDEYAAARYTTTPPPAPATPPRLSPCTNNRSMPSPRTIPRPAFPALNSLSSPSQRVSNGTSNHTSYRLSRVVGNSAVGASGSTGSGGSGGSRRSIAWVKSEEVVFPCGGVVVAMDARAPEAGGLGNQRFLTAQQPSSSSSSTVKCVCVSHHAPLLAVVSSQGHGGSGSDSNTSSSASSSSSSCLWDLGAQKCLCDFGSSSYASALITCSFSACDRFLVTVGRDAHHRTLLVVWSITQLQRGGELGGGGGSGIPSAGPVLTRQATVARQVSDFDITSIAFHPQDHSRLVSCGRENVRFWRVSRQHLPGSPAEVPKALGLEYPFRGHNFAALTFEAKETPPPLPLSVAATTSADDSASTAAAAATKVVFIASDQGCLLQVDATSRQILSFLGLHADPITCVVASEGYVATGDSSGLLKVWPLDFKEHLMQAQHDCGVAAIAVSQDDLKLAVSTVRGTLGVLDLATHDYRTLVRPHRQGVSAAALSSQGDWIATADASNGIIRLTSLVCSPDHAGGAVLFEWPSDGDQPTSLAFHPSNSLLLAAGFQSGAVRILSPTISTTSTCSSSSSIEGASHEHHLLTQPVRHVLFSSDGACLYAASGDGTLLLLDALSSFQPFGLLPPSQVLSETTAAAMATSTSLLPTSTFCGSNSGQWVVLLTGSSIALLERPMSNNGGGGRSGGGALAAGTPGLSLSLKLSVSGECLCGAFTPDSRYLLVATPTKVLCFTLTRASHAEPKLQRCAPYRTLCRLPIPATSAAFLSDDSSNSSSSQWPSLVVATSQGLQVCALNNEESSNCIKSSVLSSAPLVTVHLCAAAGCVAALDDEGSVLVWAQQQNKQPRLPFPAEINESTTEHNVLPAAEVSSSSPLSDGAEHRSAPSPPGVSPPPPPPASSLDSFPLQPPAPSLPIDEDDATAAVDDLTQRSARLRPASEEKKTAAMTPLDDGRACGGQPLSCARVLGFGDLTTCGKKVDNTAESSSSSPRVGQQHLAWVPNQGVVVYACGRHLIGWQAGQQSVVAGAHASSVTAILTLNAGGASEKKKQNSSSAVKSPNRRGKGGRKEEEQGLMVLSGSKPLPPSSSSSRLAVHQPPSYEDEEDRSACLRVWRFEPSTSDSGNGEDGDDDDDEDPSLMGGSDGAGVWKAVASLHQHDEAGVASLCAFANGDEGWWASAGGFDSALDGCLLALWTSTCRAAASALLPRPVLAMAALPPHPHRASSDTSPAGLRFATAEGGGGGVALWAVAKNSELKVQRPALLASIPVNCLAHVPLSPFGYSTIGGGLLACGTLDGEVHMWSFQEGKFLGLPLIVSKSGLDIGGDDENANDTAVKGLIGAGSNRIVAVSSDGALMAWEATNNDMNDDDKRGNENSGDSGHCWRALPPLPPPAQVQCSGALARDAEGCTLMCGGKGGVWLVQNATASTAAADTGDAEEEEDLLFRIASGGCGSVNLSWVLQGERLLLSGDAATGAVRLEDTALGRPVLELQTASQSPCLATAVTTTRADEEEHEDKEEEDRSGGANASSNGGGNDLWAAASYADGTVRVFDLFSVKLLCKFMPFATSSTSSTAVATATALAFVSDCLVCGGSNGQIAAVRLFPGTSRDGEGKSTATMQPAVFVSPNIGQNLPPISSLYVMETLEERWVVTLHAGLQDGCALLWVLDTGKITLFDSRSNPEVNLREPPVDIVCIADLPGLLAGCLWQNVVTKKDRPWSIKVLSVLVALAAEEKNDDEDQNSTTSAPETHLSVVNLTTQLPLPNLTCTVPGHVTCLSASPPASSSSSSSSLLSSLSTSASSSSSEISTSNFAVGTSTGAVLLLNGHLKVTSYGKGGHSGPVESLTHGSKNIASASNGEVLVWRLPKRK